MTPMWKDLLAESEGIAENLSKFFALAFTRMETLWVGREPEEPPQMEVLGKGMLEQIDELNINKFSAPDGVYPGVLKKHTPQIRNFWITNCV